MIRNFNFPTAPAVRILACGFLLVFLNQCSNPPEASTAKAELRDIEVLISTNGIIEPIDSSGIYASVDGFIKTIHASEGSNVTQGQPIIQLDTSQVQTSLASARASLLQARREARIVLTGPSREEMDPLNASIEENRLKLQQIAKDVATEELLYQKGAVSKDAVERLKEQQELLQVEADALKKNKENLLTRYPEEEKGWVRARLDVLADQVELLQRQVRDASITAPESGLLFSLSVKAGSFVTRGQLLGQIYQPGNIRLRAYVDEPDLGRIKKEQKVVIEWDGMPQKKWNGTVVKPADKVVSLNNRSIGYILCTIDGEPEELIPDVNVRVDIVTDRKDNALVVPKNAVFSHDGRPSVLVMEGQNSAIKPVETGLIAYEDIEILQGLEAGDAVVLNPFNNGTDN
jgi:HlyD family secretion protein